MRKNVKRIAVFVVALFITFTVVPFTSASSYAFNYLTSSNYIKDTVGNEFMLPYKPFVKEGIFYVPLRASIESAGGIVTYNRENRSIFLRYGDRVGRLALGKTTGTVNNTPFVFARKVFVIRGRTAVDVRFVTLLLNGKEKINSDTCTITFYPIFSKRDALNNDVVLYKEPKRIVSLAPNLTEILYAIGAGDRIVGVSSYSDYPEDAKSKPRVGGFFTPSIEKIFALSPDIVLVARGTPLTTINKFKELGLCTYTSDPHTINDIYNLIFTIGRITGNIKESDILVKKMRATEKSIVGKAKNILHKKKVYVEIWNNPKMSVGKNTFMNSLISEAGGINITAKLNGDWPIINSEYIIKENPDVIILLYPGTER
jgi:ABC-type Fe3+-hydroxamate transport system substrate-binding protein